MWTNVGFWFQSVAVDLKHPRGVGIIQEVGLANHQNHLRVCRVSRGSVSQLVGRSDVLVENFLPGKLHQMGLGYQQLSSQNPRLVYCSISGTNSGFWV